MTFPVLRNIGDKRGVFWRPCYDVIDCAIATYYPRPAPTICDQKTAEQTHANVAWHRTYIPHGFTAAVDVVTRSCPQPHAQRFRPCKIPQTAGNTVPGLTLTRYWLLTLDGAASTAA